MHISDERKDSLLKFQKNIGVDFSDIFLLNQALIHSSYTSENNLNVALSYERQEFYGDAVLKLVVSDFLYNRYTELQEGDLTKYRAYLVSDENICLWAKKLNMGEFLILGKNEQKQGGRFKESILACAFEALLGAIFIEYKENGYKRVKDFMEENFIDEIFSIPQKVQFLNPKATLQEYTQAKNKDLPSYKIVKETGSAHNRTFFAQVIYENKIIGEGCAKSIKKAEQEAAYDALLKLDIIKKGE